jgi:hypothetical protein
LGVILHVTVPSLSNPEPKKATVPPVDPELGEKTICGTTLKLGGYVAGVTVTPPGYPFVLTMTVYPAARYTDPMPTLNLAVSCP